MKIDIFIFKVIQCKMISFKALFHPMFNKSQRKIKESNEIFQAIVPLKNGTPKLNVSFNSTFDKIRV